MRPLDLAGMVVGELSPQEALDEALLSACLASHAGRAGATAEKCRREVGRALEELGTPELDASRARTHGAAGIASEDGYHWLSVERAPEGSEGLSGDGAGSPSITRRDRAAPPLLRRGMDEGEMDRAGAFVVGLVVIGVGWLTIVASALWFWSATQ